MLGFFLGKKEESRDFKTGEMNNLVESVTAESLFKAAGEAFDRDDTVKALDLYAQVIHLQPDFEKAHVMLGFLYKERGNLLKAKLHLSKAVELKADLADAWYLLGGIASLENDAETAIKNWRRSIEISPSQEHVYVELSFALYQRKQVEEAVAVVEAGLQYFPRNIGMLQHYGNYCLYLFRYAQAMGAYMRALEQNPHSVELIFNYVVCCVVLMKLDEAFEGFAQIRRLQPDYSPALVLEGALRLKLGDFEQGWKLYEHRWNTSELTGWRFVTSKPKWDGTQSLEGKTLLIASEQGYGDTIQFCRFIPQLEKFGCTVHFVVLSPLYEMMEQMSGVTQLLRETDPLPVYDYYCDLMSVPLALQVTVESIPSASGYLRSMESRVLHWRSRLEHQKRQRRVGIVWAGNPEHKNNYLRSISFAAIQQLFALDLDFTILQKEIGAVEKQELQRFDNVHFYGDEVTTFIDTAALVELMDIVVTVDTSVAHLAGAMNKPTWVLLSYHSDWRWLLNTDRSPWYDSVRLFRQQIGEPWANVVETVKLALAK
ncbi:glycosyltransferase family protein [Undibacterium sp. LX40W]|uniref:Glycosyltransferase family protein n=2 Tax=Undibacterium TaxID=401469 RepID=A0A923HPE6_9BURK|nr:tetratricopeptide repeat-containing glycosyltransferase family protein [Undibacterium nitidum]MBC3880835.1 glycosyltransferase family protein [Undibacterium nitidum]MBC3890432.1 glycosyltransferase family protein [Undibacterium sp. LX40W]